MIFSSRPATSKTLKQGRVGLGLILMSMLFMRLVWMDLRTYSVTADPKAVAVLENTASATCTLQDKTVIYPQHIVPRQHLSEWADSHLYRLFLMASCESGLLNVRSYVRMNQGLLVLCVVLCVFISRFFTKSWLLCITTAAVLMSRGRLISANGDISGQAMMTALVTLWVAVACHWLRSGSRWSRNFVLVFPLALTWVDFSLGFIGMAVVLAYGTLYLIRRWMTIPLFQKLRWDLSQSRRLATCPPQVQPDPNPGSLTSVLRSLLGWREPLEWGYRPLQLRYEAGSLLRSLDVPFVLWLQHKRQWKPLILTFGVGGLVQLAYVVFTLSHHREIWWLQSWFALKPWFDGFFMSVDLDIAASFCILGLCLLFSPVWGLTSFWEATWLLFWTLGLAAIGAYVWDSFTWQIAGVGAHMGKAGEILLWFEPLLITFALVGIYHLMRAVDQKLRSL
ncbi:hypothetical protein [Pseudobacteriovorax antillogorgiicola]|uniref:Uncharacterized protein n=1 Tax=Pseudobacteriovorax antillogorgiicola TaxID=1513793 RepID=A0A1Y6BIP9_9BACT|nr:hypothetical protein [Pseudobacteriovorax antillogorgiicola]TCS55361.1 hypothetical protein EDD56_10582 [Pseudobacteriovorax antillogorgiicola]SMF13547.1 hypothetical protein SAMN06296036_105242 [Pseudobacteriovorax antillogorgiicola]